MIIEKTVIEGNRYNVCLDGNLLDECAMTYKDVARWFETPEPEPVPDEWYDEWRECLE